MSNQLPEAKLPSWNVPAVRSLPNIPTVGCVSGNASMQIGSQMGNLPDLTALPQIKSLKKVFEEKIEMLIEGKLPDLPRSIAYEARKVKLIAELAQIVAKSAEIAAQIQSEINQAIAACNQKIDEINRLKSEIEGLPATTGNVLQQKALGRYNAYIGEINAQKAKLQQSLGCLN